jgi:hypothetical protein
VAQRFSAAISTLFSEAASAAEVMMQAAKEFFRSLPDGAELHSSQALIFESGDSFTSMRFI